jgi:hypothetical protein
MWQLATACCRLSGCDVAAHHISMDCGTTAAHPRLRRCQPRTAPHSHWGMRFSGRSVARTSTALSGRYRSIGAGHRWTACVYGVARLHGVWATRTFATASLCRMVAECLNCVPRLIQGCGMYSLCCCMRWRHTLHLCTTTVFCMQPQVTVMMYCMGVPSPRV